MTATHSGCLIRYWSFFFIAFLRIQHFELTCSCFANMVSKLTKSGPDDVVNCCLYGKISHFMVGNLVGDHNPQLFPDLHPLRTRMSGDNAFVPRSDVLQTSVCHQLPEAFLLGFVFPSLSWLVCTLHIFGLSHVYIFFKALQLKVSFILLIIHFRGVSLRIDQFFNFHTLLLA